MLAERVVMVVVVGSKPAGVFERNLATEAALGSAEGSGSVEVCGGTGQTVLEACTPLCEGRQSSCSELND